MNLKDLKKAIQMVESESGVDCVMEVPLFLQVNNTLFNLFGIGVFDTEINGEYDKCVII